MFLSLLSLDMLHYLCYVSAHLACCENNAFWQNAESDRDGLFWLALTAIKHDLSEEIKLFFLTHHIKCL